MLKSQEAMTNWARHGSVSRLPGLDFPFIGDGQEGRELAMARWSMQLHRMSLARRVIAA